MGISANSATSPARGALVSAIARELACRASANAAAREVAPAFSRSQVKELATPILLMDTASPALRKAGPGDAADVHATGIDQILPGGDPVRLTGAEAAHLDAHRKSCGHDLPD